jgi:hypothetical protein
MADPTPKPPSTATSNAAATGIVTGSLIAAAVVVSVVGWGVQRALDRTFKKRR